jgi:hypothetical protein
MPAQFKNVNNVRYLVRQAKEGSTDRYKRRSLVSKGAYYHAHKEIQDYEEPIDLFEEPPGLMSKPAITPTLSYEDKAKILKELHRRYPPNKITIGDTPNRTFKADSTFVFTQTFCGECLHWKDENCSHYQFTNTSPRMKVTLSFGCASCAAFQPLITINETQ